MTTTEIVSAILNGEADGNLKGIVDATREREKYLGQSLFFTLKVGDRVRLTGGQKYLAGALATVTAKKQTKVVIDLDQPRGRFHRHISCPVSLVEKV